MSRPSISDCLGFLQYTDEGTYLLGRRLTIGGTIEISVERGAAQDGVAGAGVWLPATVQSIRGDETIFSTSFATFKAEPSLRARWPAGAAPFTRRELSQLFTMTAARTGDRLTRLAQRFAVDPELRRAPNVQLAAYATAIGDETDTVAALAALLELVSQDITAGADRAMLIVAPPTPTTPTNRRLGK